MYLYLIFHLPILINRIILALSFCFLTIRFLLPLWNFASPLFAPEALVFDSFYSSAAPIVSLMDDDLARAVRPFLPQGGEASVTIDKRGPLTKGEEARLAEVLRLQELISTLLTNLNAKSSVWSNHFAGESAEDLAASTLFHKEEDLNDPEKLQVVYGDLQSLKENSRYYFRTITWVRTEKKVRSGELPITFITKDDTEG
ncbi:unnamed protein product [Urochloa humidicola]